MSRALRTVLSLLVVVLMVAGVVTFLLWRQIDTFRATPFGTIEEKVVEVPPGASPRTVIKALAKGEKVELRNFGIFEVRVRKARIGRNPGAPDTKVPIPARSAVRFKAGREMRLAVQQLAPALAKSAAQPSA